MTASTTVAEFCDSNRMNSLAKLKNIYYLAKYFTESVCQLARWLSDLFFFLHLIMWFCWFFSNRSPTSILCPFGSGPQEADPYRLHSTPKLPATDFLWGRGGRPQMRGTSLRWEGRPLRGSVLTVIVTVLTCPVLAEVAFLYDDHQR